MNDQRKADLKKQKMLKLKQPFRINTGQFSAIQASEDFLQGF